MVFSFLKRKREDTSIDEDLSLLKSSLDLTNNTATNNSLESHDISLSNTNPINFNQDTSSLNNSFFEGNGIPLNKESPLLNNLDNRRVTTFLERGENLNNFQYDKNSLNSFSNATNYNERELLLKLEVIESKIEKLESKIDMIYNILMYNKK